MNPLAGLSILVLEDEFLIAADVEQLCLEHGAEQVTVSHSVEALGPTPITSIGFDAAVLDMRLNGVETLEFGASLLAAGKPFVFATGYADKAGLSAAFPDIEIVPKPYSGNSLIGAIRGAVDRRRDGG